MGRHKNMQTTEVKSGQRKQLAQKTEKKTTNYNLAETQREHFELTLHESEEHLRNFQNKIGVAQLAGGVAHHFNNIMSAVTGYATLLQTKMSPGDPLAAYVEGILSSSEKAADLTKKLLAFSGQQRLRPRMADLNDAVRRAERLIPRHARSPVCINVELADGHLPVMVDAVRLEEALINIVCNGMDAMPRGGTLTIRTGSLKFGADLTDREGNPGACALLTISDTGTGMNRRVMERIFEPFFTTKEIGTGVGLGLPVAYHIIKQHNGSINVESRPGEGTTVNVYLPLMKAATDRAQQPIPLFPSYQI
jgi:signal transduction histidine kinase